MSYSSQRLSDLPPPTAQASTASLPPPEEAERAWEATQAEAEALRVDGPIFTAVVELLATVGECDEAKRPMLAVALRLSFITARERRL